MLISYAHDQDSVILRVKILDSAATTGAGKTGLSSASSGLIISTIADNEETATAYTAEAGNVETITTLGTYQAPTSGKCRFKEVSANHPGVYEIHITDERFATANAKSILVSISGATDAAECDALIPLVILDPYGATLGTPNGASIAEDIAAIPIISTVVVSAASVAATAAADSGILTITRYSTFRARITGLGNLADRTGLKFVLKPSIRTLKHTTDAQALLVIDEAAGLEILSAAAAGDSSLASLAVIDEDEGTVDLFIDETVCGLLASRERAPYSFKKLIAGGDDQELTSVDYPGGATTHARILEAVTQEV